MRESHGFAETRVQQAEEYHRGHQLEVTPDQPAGLCTRCCSLFILGIPCSPLRISGEQGVVKVNRPVSVTHTRKKRFDFYFILTNIRALPALSYRGLFSANLTKTWWFVFVACHDGCFFFNNFLVWGREGSNDHSSSLAYHTRLIVNVVGTSCGNVEVEDHVTMLDCTVLCMTTTASAWNNDINDAWTIAPSHEWLREENRV